jgi:hypothetical protein
MNGWRIEEAIAVMKINGVWRIEEMKMKANVHEEAVANVNNVKIINGVMRQHGAENRAKSAGGIARK